MKKDDANYNKGGKLMAFKKYISAVSSVVLTASLAAANIPAKADEPVTAQITTTDRIVMDVELDEKMFLQDSSVYHHDIGMLALAFACSAYDTADTRGKGTFISDAYKALGFIKQVLQVRTVIG